MAAHRGSLSVHMVQRASLNTFFSIIFFIFGFSSSFTLEFNSFILFRIGVGFGIGFIIPTVQAIITEMSPLNYRGFSSVIIWLGFPLGEIYICLIAKKFPLDDKQLHDSNWTILMLLATFPVIFL